MVYSGFHFCHRAGHKANGCPHPIDFNISTWASESTTETPPTATHNHIQLVGDSWQLSVLSNSKVLFFSCAFALLDLQTFLLVVLSRAWLCFRASGRAFAYSPFPPLPSHTDDPCISVDNPLDNPWISMDHQKIPMDNPWIPMDDPGYPWIIHDIHGLSMDIHGYPWISTDINGYA